MCGTQNSEPGQCSFLKLCLQIEDEKESQETIRLECNPMW